jgi:MinD superfamily P-loop ATPase
MGQLNVGEAMSPPLIREIGNCLASMLEKTGGDAIIDAPPGTSCPAMSAVRDADVLVLVSEPTPFGLHDLQLAWRAFASAGKPAGVVINRAGWEGGAGDAAMYSFCRDEGLTVLAEFPFERMVAEAYAKKGWSLDRASSRHRHAVAKLVSRVSALGYAAQ